MPLRCDQDEQLDVVTDPVETDAYVQFLRWLCIEERPPVRERYQAGRDDAKPMGAE